MKRTDLLFGVVSFASGKDEHYLFADFDNVTELELMEKIGKILIEKHKFGVCYIVRSGKGFHVLNFTEKLTLAKYVKILEELGSDPKFIEWVEKVKYGVLRISRRSNHMRVPKLSKVLLSPYKKSEDLFMRNFYFMLLKLELAYINVERVIVIEERDKIEKELRKSASSLGFKLVKIEKNDNKKD